MRVGFQFFGGNHWAGGTQYLSNLLSALHDLPEKPVEAVLFVEAQADAAIVDRLRPFLSAAPVSLQTHSRAAGAARRALTFTLQRDPVAARAFRDSGIDVIFQHMVWYGSRIGIPTVAWIPDFQHRRLPRMFGPVSWMKRELGFQALTRSADVVMLSSEDARRDCERYYPTARRKISTVPFAVEVPQRALETGGEDVRAKHGLPEKFLFFPGQLYKHKNHLGVIQALRHLKECGSPVVMAVSGSFQDRRNPGHIQDITAAIEEFRLEHEVRLLGFIAYDDMLQLMRLATAVVNASFCEGWSTTVEEAKALGIPLVLSNLDVHREQAGHAARFFDPMDPESIAGALQDAWNAPARARPETERAAGIAAAARRLDFARKFVEVARRASGRMKEDVGEPGI
jgi:glycosyltransferase involved in cell wall biosynthesis